MEFHPLTPEDIRKQTERTLRRLEHHGLEPNDIPNAEVVEGATVVRVQKPDGSVVVSILDPRFGTDRRLIDELPRVSPPMALKNPDGSLQAVADRRVETEVIPDVNARDLPPSFASVAGAAALSGASSSRDLFRADL